MTQPSDQLRLVMKQLQSWREQGLDRLSRSGASAIAELHLELTHRCELRCRMCHHWPVPLRDPDCVRREFRLDELRAWIGSTRMLDNVRSVTLTGGEPWLHPQAVDIIVFLRRRFAQASLGVLSHMLDAAGLRRRLKELASRGVGGLWLGTSLDGIGRTHDLMRGRPGAFAGLVRTLDMLREEFPDVRVSMNFTITPKNISDLWPAYGFARDRGLWFGAQFVVDHEGYPAPEEFSWRKGGLDEAAQQIGRIMEDLCVSQRALEKLLTLPARQSQWLWSSLLYWHHLREGLGKGPAFVSACQAGSRYAMIDPEGNLFFCPVLKHRQAGNLRHKSLDELWGSRRVRELRRDMSSCRRRCWLNCIAYPLLDRILDAAWGLGEPARPELMPA